MYNDGLVFNSKEAIWQRRKANIWTNVDQRRAFQSYILYKITYLLFCYSERFNLYLYNIFMQELQLQD